MTDNDIERIVSAINKNQHTCVFSDAEREQLKHSMEFYERCNKIISSSGETARNSVIRFVVIGGMALLIWGCAAVMKMKQADLIP